MELDLLGVLATEELIENVAPISWGIRLLISGGLAVAGIGRCEAWRGGRVMRSRWFYPWTNADGRWILLSETVQAIAAEGDRRRNRAVWRLRGFGSGAFGCCIDAPELRVKEGRGVPFLSEPWYCCAEPTRDHWWLSAGRLHRRRQRRKLWRLMGLFRCNGK